MPSDDILVENGRAWSKAWCANCRSVQEIELGYVAADARGPDALDIICRHCRSVIAALHRSTPVRLEFYQ